MALYDCPICHNELIVIPSGPKTSPILFVASKPEDDDYKNGRPLSGSARSVLRSEFAYRGVDIRVIRMISFHIHADPDKKCIEFSASEVMKEAKDKKLVVLIGVEANKYFLHKGVGSCNGLLFKCDYFSAPVMCMEKPTMIFRKGGTVGEMRFAIQNISDYIIQKGLLK